ncbi:uncharacterized protein M6B38_283200 [Iris pallida]|uniref:Annexin D4-like n=1 Tax=Iris pallida TaxID=29817 RepID=A0AAX6F3U2_IRIPA|nr:annexin D4-like [Iris pallida]KAJ6846773.1 uncharacterized protein M6B38_283200 [Iris pallida]
MLSQKNKKSNGRSSPIPNPETLMADVDAAIAAHEYSLSTSLLPNFSSSSSSSSSPSTTPDNHNKTTITSSGREDSSYDVRLADEAYKSACAALAAGRSGVAVRSLLLAISSCPPDRGSALSKLRSLLSIATSKEQQQQKLKVSPS